ncbi:FAD-dependent monooxygenase [Nonomuraea sp. NPDC049400]|uniref:FAD-dependent monooxygenase n=1 Tax=Nonomuraea sp. NPDC049400 TaxID=3364352 RepID=UPI0037944977
MNRLERWYAEGVLLISDAAHALSPAGGMGINLAIQDAVAAGTLLIEPLRAGRLSTADLARVQKRRRWPTVLVQRYQQILHRAMFVPAFSGRGARAPRPLVFLARYFSPFKKIPSKLLASGPRPEHAPAYALRAEQRS